MSDPQAEDGGGSDVPRLLRWFEAGDLVRPRQGRTTTVDLVRALYARCGDEPAGAGPRVRYLESAIGRHDHYLFVIVDGLGSKVARRGVPGGFLARHRVADLEPVFPSTTAAAITSFATAAYPSEHGVPTWWVHLPEPGVTATILPFVERYGEADLREHGVTPADAYPLPSRVPGLLREVTTILPAGIVTSVYSDYQAGGGPRLPYESPEEAFELAGRRIREASGRTFTWLYLPDVDARSHVHGPEAEAVTEEVRRTEALLERLVAKLDGAARIVVTADHGLVTVPEDSRFEILPDDPLLESLAVPPTGEPATPVFHVRAGRTSEFAAGFRGRFGERFALLATREVEDLELLGPGRLSPATRSRLGDFLAIPRRPAVLLYRADSGAQNDFRGFHAGLSPAEMSVPLILA